MPTYDLFNSPIMQAAWQKPVDAEFLRGMVQAGGGQQLQEAVAEEQAQNNFNRDMANAALMSEMANRGAYNTESQAPAYQQGLMPSLGANQAPQEEAQPAQRMPLNQMAKVLADQIVQAKGYYAQAEQAGNTEAMMQAHNAAEQARKGLLQLGVDPQAYGLNGTYQEAQEAMASNNLQAMQNILEGGMSQTSMGYYDDTYNYLINQGYSRDIAAEVAGQKATSYAIQRTKELENAFNMYGHDGRVINPMGVQILQKLAEEEPDMAGYYTQRFAGPLQEYAKANQRENAAIQHQYGKENRADAFNYDIQKMGIAQEQRKEMAAINAQIQEAHANNNMVRAVQQAGMLYELQAKYGVGKGAKNANGVAQGQADKAAKMIESIDKQLANGLDLSEEEKAKLKAERAKYQSVVDAYIGFGQQNSGQLDPANNYDDFIAYYTDVINKNDGTFSKDDIFADAKRVNPAWAEDIKEYLYGGGNTETVSPVQPAAQETAPAKQPVVDNSRTTNTNYGTDANWAALTYRNPERSIGKRFLNIVFPDPNQYVSR